MYSLLDTSTPNSGLGTPLRAGGEIINANFKKLYTWIESRANIAANAIPTLAAGGPAYLLAVEYSAGNPMPLTVYKRRGTAPADTTNPAYVQSTDGQWWELAPQGGNVYIEQFGGKADFVSVPTGTTDNYGPTLKAIDFVAITFTSVAKLSYKIVFGYGNYWFSQGLDLHTTIWLQGQNRPGGFEPWGTKLTFPSTVTCILISQNNTVGEAGTGTNTGQGNATVIEGVCINQFWASGSFGTLATFNVSSPAAGQGIHARAVCTIKDCAFTSIKGHAIYIHGQSGGGGAREGAPNEWKVFNCEVHSCGGDGLRVADMGANAGTCIGFTTRTCGGSGIHDEAPFVNSYTNIHIAGYGNWLVRYPAGTPSVYQLIGGAGSTVPSTTVPGTNNLIWLYMGELGAHPRIYDWNSTAAGMPSDFSMYRAPIWDNGGSKVYTAVYVENSLTKIHCPGGSIVVGGTNSVTDYSNRVLGSNTGIKSDTGYTQAKQLPEGSPQWTKYGPYPFVQLGGEHSQNGLAANGGPNILSWGTPDKTTGPAESWAFGFLLNRIMMQSGWGTAFMLQTQFSTDTFGRNSPDSNRGRMAIADPIIIDTNDLDGRRIGYRVGRPAPSDSGGTYKAQGEFYFTKLPRDMGLLGWSCITAGDGAAAQFGTVPVFGINSVDPQNNGECVLENTSNTQAKLKFRGSDGVVRSITFTLS
jgi:hypothetical protein